jgi:hypothetical protein
MNIPVSLQIGDYFLIFIISGISAYIGAYFKQKGNNLATREDIGKITKIVESIKSKNEEQLELFRQENRISLQSRDQTHQLSVAALDKRLTAHQEAYALWWELRGSVNKEDDIVDNVVEKCKDWWAHNNLYLNSKPREAFIKAYCAASRHREVIQTWKNHDNREDDNRRVEENWDRIERVGQIIEEEMKLPSIKDVINSIVETTPRRIGGAQGFRPA